MSNRILVQRYSGNRLLRHYDKYTGETFRCDGGVWGRDDFVGAAVNTTDGLWALLDTAGGAEGLSADAAGGAMSIALTNTSEAQLAGISWGDQHGLSIGTLAILEFRIKLSVLPTSGTIGVFGLASDHNATADTVAVNAWFRVEGDGVVLAESDDTSTDVDDTATGTTLTTSDWMIGRVEATSSAATFFINGAQVASSTSFVLTAASPTVLQPYFRLNKASGTSVGTALIDYVAWAMLR